ncbi:MAG TPA: NHL repeat-containing protein [Puia sp.]|nr:NHL repeat-containing protein [Puia sp.]
MKHNIFFAVLTALSVGLIMTSCTPSTMNQGGSHTNTGNPIGLVTTLAGPNFLIGNVASNTASFNGPRGVAVDANGNVYVADQNNNMIRKISPTGEVTTLAGNGTKGSSNGVGTSATFAQPEGIAVDGSGNLYVADFGNNMIRKISPTGSVSTLAGNGTAGSANGAGNAATFDGPTGIAVDQIGNVYVADYTNNLIRLISSSGVVRTLAGSGTAGSTNGVATLASFNNPAGITVDAGGNAYVADSRNQLIRMISPSAVVTTLAGTGQLGYADGPASTAAFDFPFGIALDASGNVFVAEQGSQTIREISTSGVVSTFAGSSAVGSRNGIGTSASFWFPSGVAVDAQENVYVADYSNNMIRKINSAAVVTTLAGTGQAGSTNTTSSTGMASFDAPSGVAVDGAGNVYVADQYNDVIRMINSSGTVTTLAGSGVTYGGPGTPRPPEINGAESIVTFISPYGIALGPQGDIYVAEVDGGYTIRMISPSGTVSTLAGSPLGYTGSANGPGSVATFGDPKGVATDKAGNVYVADAGNNLIRMISPSGVVSTFAGNGQAGLVNGPSASASFNQPSGVAVDGEGNVIVADAGNNVIRSIATNGIVATLSGNGSPGSTDGNIQALISYNNPTGLAIDDLGYIYVSDQGNNKIRVINPNNQQVSTFAGNGTQGASNGLGSNASFSKPTGIAVDAMGNVYVADQGNNLIRKITPQN